MGISTKVQVPLVPKVMSPPGVGVIGGASLPR